MAGKGNSTGTSGSSGSGKGSKGSYQSAVTGHFVSAHYAKTHPKTTVHHKPKGK